MSRKSNFARTVPIAGALSLLLSSTVWATVVNVRVNVPVVHPKVSIGSVKPNVSNAAITTGFTPANSNTISSATSGGGAGKVRFNEFQVTKTVDKASPNLFKNTAKGEHIKRTTIQN
jgi:hypothetical protein